MANSGKNTNKQQFFITFAAASHLDQKHTVFGKVLPETIQTLDRIEKAPANSVEILETKVLSNPFRQCIG